MANQINSRLVMRNDTKANWEAVKNTAILLPGEVGVESDTGLFKVGKLQADGVTPCTWGELSYANDVDLSTVTNSVKVAVSLAELGTGEVVGDMGIVKAPLYDGADTYAHTAYVWNGTSWAAMDGNYDADNVYFDSNLVMTANIGVQSLGSASSKDLATQGKSLKQVLSMILAKEEKPTITANPSVTTYLNNTTSTTADPTNNSNLTVEGGSTITPRWKATFSGGTYKYGPATGVTPKSWEAYGYLNGTKVSGHSATTVGAQSFGSVTLAAGNVYKVNAKATYDAGAIANTNLGEEYKAGNALFDETSGATVVQIAAGSKNDDSPTITAWQQGYYIGTLENANTEVTSNILRNTGDGAGVLKNRFVRNANYSAGETLKFEPGQKGAFTGTMAKFIVAYPSSIDKDADGTFKSNKGLTKFFNNSSFEEYVTNFTKSTLKVAGADNNLGSAHAVEYTICTWTPAAAFSGATKFEVVLS